MRNRSLVALFSLLFALFFLTGCPSRPQPQPGDTVLGSGEGVDPGLYVPQGQVTRDEFAQGLEARNPGFSPGESARMENVLSPVFFGFDEAFIAPDQRRGLTQAADYLQQNPSSNLLVEGHCDYKGTSEYNLALGQRRADAVKQFLVQLGLSPDRVETTSRGDLEAQEGAGVSARSQDRRADLIVLR